MTVVMGSSPAKDSEAGAASANFWREVLSLLGFQSGDGYRGCPWNLAVSYRYHRRMPDTTEDFQTNYPAHSQSALPAETTSQKVLRWAAPIAVLIALIAVAVAVWALTNSSSKAPATAKLAGDPKMRVCTAFNTVAQAVTLETHADLGPDPVPQAAVAANARLSLLGGGQYLLNQLDSATPQELADSVRSFANDLQDIGVNALAGVPNSDPNQSNRLTQGDLARKQIVDLCK